MTIQVGTDVEPIDGSGPNSRTRCWIAILLISLASLTQTACGYIAAGAAGAAIGHEVAEERHEDDEDDE